MRSHRYRLRRLQEEADRQRWREKNEDNRDRIPMTLMQIAGLKPSTEEDWRRLREWMERHGFSSESAAAGSSGGRTSRRSRSRRASGENGAFSEASRGRTT